MSEREELIAEQIKKAMPLLGPLLDAWDSVPGDAKAYAIECWPPFGRLIDELHSVMDCQP